MLKYRKELDGLRCLAVMAVIIYHSGISLFGVKIFKGGFFGVDVFLVLSGYLITDIIINKLDSRSFSLTDFYWRRIKRIVPALIAMLVVTSIVAYKILLPNDLVKFSESLISAIYFGSNYYFLGEDSYVSNASIFKPLLHTWSLAVEWQFYVFYPFLLIFINKFIKKYRVLLLILISVSSIVYANIIVSSYPDLTFYTLLPRAWELILGGIMSFFVKERRSNIHKDRSSLTSYLPVIGMLMIVYSMLFFGNDIKHPSFITLIPVAGSCLIIAFANGADLISKILSLRPIVFIGLISYSLYLWHQPVFVFYRILFSENITPYYCVALASISIVIASFSYFFIEKPYRAKHVKSKNTIVLATSLSALLAFSIYAKADGGFQWRLAGILKETYEMYKEPEFRKLADYSNIGKSLRGEPDSYLCGLRSLDNPCNFGGDDIIVLGDSYAGQYAPTILDYSKENNKGMLSLTYEQCPFVSDMWFGNVPECVVVNEQRWKAIDSLKGKKTIFIAANYDQFPLAKAPVSSPLEMAKQNFSGGDFLGGEQAYISLSNNVKKLVSKGHDVYIVYPTPNPSEDVANIVFSKLRSINYKFETTYTSSRNGLNLAKQQSDILDKYIPDMKGLHKIKPIKTLCDDNGCRIIDHNGGLYNVGFHLSKSGVKEILNDNGFVIN